MPNNQATDIFIKMDVTNRYHESSGNYSIAYPMVFQQCEQDLKEQPVISLAGCNTVKATMKDWAIIIFIFTRRQTCFLPTMKPILKK